MNIYQDRKQKCGFCLLKFGPKCKKTNIQYSGKKIKKSPSLNKHLVKIITENSLIDLNRINRNSRQKLVFVVTLTLAFFSF